MLKFLTVCFVLAVLCADLYANSAPAYYPAPETDDSPA